MIHAESAPLHPLLPSLESAQSLLIGDTHCQAVRELGRGKSGISWLVKCAGVERVLKLIHHQPNSFYRFDADKLGCELDAEQRLRRLGVPMPELLSYSVDKDWLLKEYIHGEDAPELIAQDRVPQECFAQLAELHRICRDAGLNLDWFPANFVLRDKRLYYIDYETNPYSEEWNFPNWGLWYWLNASGFARWLQDGRGEHLNQDQSGHPLREGLQAAHIEISSAFLL